MNKIKRNVIAISFAGALVPTLGNTASVSQGFNACIDALAVDLKQTYGEQINVRAHDQTFYTSKRMKNHEVFELVAERNDGGEVLSRTLCTVNKRARVKRLRTLSLKD